MRKVALLLFVGLMIGGSLTSSSNLNAAEELFFWKKKKAKKEKKEKQDTSKYDKLTKEGVCDTGMFNVYKVKNDYYFEIPKKLENRDLLIVNKISKVPEPYNEAGVNKGMNYENLVIRFTVNEEHNKVYALQYKPFVETRKEDNIAASVEDNFSKSILEYFNIEAFSPDSSSVLIKVNKVYDGSKKSFNNVFGMTGVGTSPLTDYSFIERVKSFPRNIVVKSLQTTNIPGAETKAKMTVEVTSNLVLLPEKPMVPRFEDSRVGYFTCRRWYINDDQHSVEKRKLVTRWRLEPKDKEAYFRGELVEPVKPIVFYIDPATPDKWRKHIIAGVFDWQKAFEKAGFKNAIIAKEVSADDTDFDVDDVRYSVITYVASDKANAMGPSVFDPRSGEIIEADVIWWHNVMTAVHSWMRVQTGAIDPKARANRFEDEHMGEAIRFVSSHELGHTFGLKHNMGASFTYPVDSLRSPSFCEKMATAPSIMDYARFNYVAQPGDGVKAITPKIGVYDEFAIEWAYRYYSEQDAHKELARSEKFIKEAYKNPLCRYVAQQDMRSCIDPRGQSEDLGDNSVKASEYGIKNLKRIMDQLIDWTTKNGESYLEAGKLANAVIGQWHQFSYHVLANVGGVYMNNTIKGDNVDSYEFVSKERQKEAVDYLVRNVFNCPEWLFKSDIYKQVYPIKDSPAGYREYNPFASFKNAQSYIFWDILNNTRLERMIANEATNGKDAYTANDLMDDMHAGIFKKTIKRRSLDVYERATQKAFVDALIIAVDRSAVAKVKKGIRTEEMHNQFDSNNYCSCSRCASSEDKNFNSEVLFSGPNRVSDAISVKRGELLRIEKLFKSRRNSGDRSTLYHYEDLLLRIDKALR